MSSGTVWVWSAVFTGWTIKLAILKFGRLEMYRKAVPWINIQYIGLSRLVLTKIILTSIQQNTYVRHNYDQNPAKRIS